MFIQLVNVLIAESLYLHKRIPNQKRKYFERTKKLKQNFRFISDYAAMIL